MLLGLGKHNIKPHGARRTQGYCFDDFGNALPVAGCNVDDDNVAVERRDMAAVGYLIVKIVDCEIVAVGR